MGLFAFSLACEQWWYFFIAAAILIGVLLYIIFTEWGSMGSLIGVAALTVFQAVLFVLRYSAELTNVWSLLMFALLLAVDFVTWFAHRTNICKLLAGEEHHTSVRRKKRS